MDLEAEPPRIKTFVQYPPLPPWDHIFIEIPDHSIELERGRVEAVVVIASTCRIDRVMTSFVCFVLSRSLCIPSYDLL